MSIGQHLGRVAQLLQAIQQHIELVGQHGGHRVGQARDDEWSRAGVVEQHVEQHLVGRLDQRQIRMQNRRGVCHGHEWYRSTRQPAMCHYPLESWPAPSSPERGCDLSPSSWQASPPSPLPPHHLPLPSDTTQRHTSVPSSHGLYVNEFKKRVLHIKYIPPLFSYLIAS